MKKIRIKICGYDAKDEFSYGHFLVGILSKYYIVELSDNPEYVFYNESTSEYLKYDCVRIFYTGENVTPNFNFCDYAIGFDWLDFGDRYYRLPLYLVAVFYSKDELRMAGDNFLTKRAAISKLDLSKKDKFCSFIYSNYLADNTRKLFFDKLSKYKKIDAGGAYLNNTGGRVANKLEFESSHKFSIAFENTSRSGYTTEKLVGSLVAGTIPIYWGNPDIGKEFNEKRFINCHKFSNFDEVIERIKEIDANDDLYLSIVNEPITTESYDFGKVKMGFESFLVKIIDQPIESARRRTKNSVRISAMEKNELAISRSVAFRAKVKKIFAIIYKPLKRINYFEKIKQQYFRKIK